MRREKREDRKAAEYAHQLDIWWKAQGRLYVTTDKNGKLAFWNIGSIEGTGDIGPFAPVKEVIAHKRKVTCFIELGSRKFVSASLDRTVVVWDSINIVPENRIEEHTASVLSVAYLAQFYSLVSVGCEKRVYVWSIDSTAYRGLTAKLSGHQANLLQVAGGNDCRGRVFITLDEASQVILWDVATLQQIQTFSAETFAPKHVICISNYGRCCLGGRRFYFYEGNELLGSYMGALPTKEQIAKAKNKPRVEGSFKERARPHWCGMNCTRGSVLSVTQAEVRVHCRGNPAQSRVVFCMPEGEIVTSFAVMDCFHMALLGTSKGALYFLKYRSGFTLKVYGGRAEGEAWDPTAGGPGAPPETESLEAKQRAAAGSPTRAGASITPGGGHRESIVVAASPGAADSGGNAPAGAVASSVAAAAAASYSKLGRPPGTGSREAHGGRTSEALGAEAQTGENSQASLGSEELERALEREQELKEVHQVMSMGFVEADARRALAQVPRARAVLTKPHDQDAELKLADARATNVEQAVEKLLTGVIATVGEELPPARLAARADMLQGEDPQARAKNLKKVRKIDKSLPGDAPSQKEEQQVSVHNAPSQKEIEKGLSRNIQCILPCEEQKRIYVGTIEGMVLVLACDANFTVIRWFSQPGPNMVAVTSLDCTYDGENGLLLVGTQDCCAHLYGLPNLRLAGSINMGRVLPETTADAGKMIAVRHARLLTMPPSLLSSYQFPLAVVTIDKRSRIRLWGLRLHGQSGKLEELALLLDGGQLYESMAGIENESPDQSKDAQAKDASSAKNDKDAKAGKSPAAGKAGRIAGAGKAAKDSKSKSGGAADMVVEVHRPTVRITALATIKEPVVIPESYVRTLPPALVPAKPAPVVAAAPVSAAFAALAAAFASGGPADATSGGDAEEADKASADAEEAGAEDKDAEGNAPRKRASVRFGEDEDEPQKENESSGTEEDVEAEVKKRHEMRPTTPDNGFEGDTEVPNPPAHVDMDGANFLFLSDSGGRIWVLDVVATAVVALEERDPLTVLLDENAARTSSKARARPSVARISNGAFMSSSTGALSTAALSEANPQPATMPLLSSKQGIPAPAPEALRVVTSWQAHTGWIQSIVPTSSPPALVTTDDHREVKVWSTTGELWGDFTLYGLVPATVSLWPPPHVLGAQHALMNIAKRLCHRLGLPTSRHGKQGSKDKEKQRKSFKKNPAKKVTAESAVLAKSVGKAKAKAKKAKPKPTIQNEEEADTEGDASAGPPVLLTELPPESPPAASPSAALAAPTGDPAKAEAPSEKQEGTEDGAAATSGDAAAADADDDEVDLDDLRATADDEGGSATPSGTREGSPGRRKKAFTGHQISEMIRNHAFSSGFHSYKQFHERGKNQAHQPETASKRRQGESLTQLEAQRHSFFGRPASAFGVVLENEKETEHWERNVRDLGPRSASEGALLRYAQSAVDEMTRSVRDDLGVDVSRISLKQMRKPSFIAQLDVKNVSYDPSNPASATAQAVRKIGNPEVPRRMTALAGAGNMLVGSSRRGRSRP